MSQKALLLVGAAAAVTIYAVTRKSEPAAIEPPAPFAEVPADKAAMIVESLSGRYSPGATATPIAVTSEPIVFYGTTRMAAPGAPPSPGSGIQSSATLFRAMLDAGRYVFVERNLLDARDVASLPERFDLIAVHPSVLKEASPKDTAGSYVLLQKPTKVAPPLPKEEPEVEPEKAVSVDAIAKEDLPAVTAKLWRYLAASKPTPHATWAGTLLAPASKLTLGAPAPDGAMALTAMINELAKDRWVFLPTMIAAAMDEASLSDTFDVIAIDPVKKSIDQAAADALKKSGYVLVLKPGDVPLVDPPLLVSGGTPVLTSA